MLSQFVPKRKLLPSSLKNVYWCSLYCSNTPAEKPPVQNESYAQIHRRIHTPNDFERRMLVWTKRFKTLEEVPPTVTAETLEKARNMMRIKVANWMMLGTVLGCIIMIITGKKAAKEGESISKMNMDWHKEMNKKEQ